MNKILIGCAMYDEAKDIIKSLELKLLDNKNIYSNKDNSIYLIITGIGIANALFELTNFLASKKDIEKIINIGFAGANNLTKHKFYYANNVFLLDANHTSPLLTYPKYYLPGIEQTKLSSSSQLDGYPLFSSSTFQTTIIPNQDKYLADMEGYSYFYIAQKYNLKLEIFKYVSDLIQSTNQANDYTETEKCASIKIAEFIKDYLNL